MALRQHGPFMGAAWVFQGNSYAILARYENNKLVPVSIIGRYIQAFLRFAASHHELTSARRP